MESMTLIKKAGHVCQKEGGTPKVKNKVFFPKNLKFALDKYLEG